MSVVEQVLHATISMITGGLLSWIKISVFGMPITMSLKSLFYINLTINLIYVVIKTALAFINVFFFWWVSLCTASFVLTERVIVGGPEQRLCFCLKVIIASSKMSVSVWLTPCHDVSCFQRINIEESVGLRRLMCWISQVHNCNSNITILSIFDCLFFITFNILYCELNLL